MGILLGIERTLDGPIVRQAQFGPGGILEAGLFGAGGLALEEAPAVVEIHVALARDSDGCGGRHIPWKNGQDGQGTEARGGQKPEGVFIHRHSLLIGKAEPPW
jgi:hypothetical protein